jgi:hypothetical protein
MADKTSVARHLFGAQTKRAYREVEVRSTIVDDSRQARFLLGSHFELSQKLCVADTQVK